MRNVDFDSVHKFVVNLDTRPDRMDHARKEFDYMGWEVERFPALLDENGRLGFGGFVLSNLKIIETAKERNLPSVLILEDDVVFMPWAKDTLKAIEGVDLDWDLISLAPTINRRLVEHPENESRTLVPMFGELPEKRHNERGIFGCSAILYNSTMYDRLLDYWSNKKKWIADTGEIVPWDVFLDQKVYPKVKAYSASLPVVTQIMDASCINRGQVANNHYLMIYNWSNYIRPICKRYLDLGYTLQARDSGSYTISCP
tara:strand:+ start:1787 stop:2557 length:771 start_codon:yes stop_codon:yes gene_type:complete